MQQSSSMTTFCELLYPSDRNESKWQWMDVENWLTIRKSIVVLFRSEVRYCSSPSILMRLSSKVKQFHNVFQAIAESRNRSFEG